MRCAESPCVVSRLVCAGLVFIGTRCLAAEDVYTVTSDPAYPHEVAVTLEMSARDVRPRTLTLRGLAWGLRSQVEAPKCGNTALVQDHDSWIVPPACNQVSWIVRPVSAVQGTVDASKQASLWFPDSQWWLLSEPTSLLRSQDSAEGIVVLKTGLGATSAGHGRWRLPSMNNAPEFFALGNFSTQTRQVGPFLVRHVADDPARVKRLGLEDMHARALRYLAGVIAPSARDSEKQVLLVIWLGMDDQHGRAGGAAGSRSFVANYVFGKPEAESVNSARTLAILAHEQFHQLVDLVRGPLASLPVWLSESLAHYYGLKALVRSSPGSTARAVYARFVDPARRVEHGLLELDRRHAAKDPTAYPAFYEQGATFWAEVDRAIRARSSDDSGLDILIPDLLRSNMQDGGGLPIAFVERLRKILGAQADELLNKYVGI